MARTVIHAKQCCICLESDATVRKLKVCSHTVHYACLSQHFKQECPVCRRKTKEVKVTGTRPSASFDIEEYLLQNVTPDEEDSQSDDDTSRIIPEDAHYFADEDEEFVRDVFRRLGRGEIVGEDEIYQCEVALRRARYNDASLTCLSHEDDEGVYDVSESSDDSHSSSDDDHGVSD